MMKKIRFVVMFAGIVFLGALLNNQIFAEERPKELETSDEKLSYVMGMQIAQSLKASGVALDLDILLLGLKDQYFERPVLLSEQDVVEVQRAYFEAQQAQEQRGAEENMKKSREFLEANLERENVEVTPSGLQYEIIEDGDGARPDGTDETVEIHYVGKTIEGEVFDSSRESGETISFPLDGIVPGLSEGIQLMQVGSVYHFFLPPELAYGESGAGGMIGPNMALIFEIELIDIVE